VLGYAEHINAGKTGGTDDFFTESMNEMWDMALKSHFADVDPKLVDWVTYGNPF